jgi:DNA-binding transcriptional MerR regulator
MQTIQLEFTLAEVNQLLDALGDKPYKQVYQLIQQIQQQAEAQLQQATADLDDGLAGQSEQ